MSERTGSTIVSRMICGVCMKDIYYRVDTEKRLNLTGCGCGERASAIDAPPFQPQPSFIQVTKVCPSCATLLAAKEKAEAALCRAREAIRSKVIDALNRHQAPMEACQDVVDSIEAALSSSSLCPHEAVAKNVRHCERCGGSYYDDGLVNLRCPCENPHEARVKELEAELAWYKEAVKWACGHEQIPSWPYFIDELRRRVGGGE